MFLVVSAPAALQTTSEYFLQAFLSYELQLYKGYSKNIHVIVDLVILLHPC